MTTEVEEKRKCFYCGRDDVELDINDICEKCSDRVEKDRHLYDEF